MRIVVASRIIVGPECACQTMIMSASIVRSDTMMVLLIDYRCVHYNKSDIRVYRWVRTVETS